MKKAQIINKILNKILIITALLYNIFSILAIKKEKPASLSFFNNPTVLFGSHSCCCVSLFGG